jgi:hypothetical protein
LTLTELPLIAEMSGGGYKYLVKFSKSNEFLVSVQAKSVSVLLSSHDVWQHQGGFVVQLDGGTSGRESLIKKCVVLDGEADKNCQFGATLVSLVTNIFRSL